MKERRAIQSTDVIHQPKAPDGYSLEDPQWAATYEWWQREWTDWETITPRGGFIEDFVLATKGTETATSFSIWTALTVIATVLTRDAYLTLYPVSWYPNLYTILVAPPGLAKKSTVLNYGASLLRGYENEILDENLKHKKRVTVHTNRVTPEGLQDLLAPSPPAPSKRGDLPDVYVDRGSQLALFISELSTFLGRQSYNLGMVSKLTDLYESKDLDTDYTKKDGRQELRNVYVNFMAGTTPGDMDSVIPEEAFGGGLMSRTVVVYEPKSVRNHPLPVKISKGPTHEELRQALAWIAVNGFGAFTLSKEALSYYYRWYSTFKENLQSYDSVRVLSASRMDVLMMKLAILIRAQRYTPGRVVEMEDLTKAEQILNKTYSGNENAVNNVGASDRGKNYNHVRTYIYDHGQVSRRKILTSFSKKLSSEELSSILDQLNEAGEIEIYLDRKKQGNVTRASMELYVANKTSGGHK